MTLSPNPSRLRVSAAALVIAGILFIIYPALRPFSDEVSLQGAAAFGSDAWLAAHMLAMVAFTLVPVGLLGIFLSLQARAGDRLAYWSLVLSMIGIGLTLPFYGGEAYGLHAIGQEALRQQSAALLSLAGDVRSGPGLILFTVGLLLLAAAAIVAALALWRSASYSKWSGIPFALGMVLFLPQFYFAQPIRVAHGVLLAIGCLWLAWGLWRQNSNGNASASS